jgi:tetraacyldisaccharide 4'-kinase
MRKQWQQLGPWHIVLIPLSWLFVLLSGLRRFSYQIGLLKSFRLSVPVIVVGNITVGGSGKTPLVIWLAKHLQQYGYLPAIISRGYRGSARSISPVFADSDPVTVGDEPVLIARQGNWPVWIGRDRAESGKKLLQAHPECNVIISDDGLQHYRLQRDIEIAVVDATCGFGNSWRLPAGPLRESQKRLKSVDAVVWNGTATQRQSFHMHLAGNIFRSVADATEVASAQDFKKQKIAAIAGIGNPERFFLQLNELGLVFKRISFPDHHAFQAHDLQSIEADVILMTEKDAVKCAAFAERNWWYLPVSAEVDEGLATFIMNKLRNLNGP